MCSWNICFFVKQASVMWNIASELWSSNHKKWNYNISLWNRLFENLKQFITKEWNRLFEKCTIEIGVIFVRQASGKWNVSSKNENNMILKCFLMNWFVGNV